MHQPHARDGVVEPKAADQQEQRDLDDLEGHQHAGQQEEIDQPAALAAHMGERIGRHRPHGDRKHHARAP